MFNKLVKAWWIFFWWSWAYTAMINHVEDGNVFGIYILDGRVLIGDFWAAIITIYLIYKGFYKLFDLVEDIKHTIHEIKKADELGKDG